MNSRWTARVIWLAVAATVVVGLAFAAARSERLRLPHGSSEHSAGTPASAVSGVVKYIGTDRPETGVKVSLPGEEASTVTGDDGSFVLNPVGSGWKTVTATKEGYITAAQTVYVSPTLPPAQVSLIMQPLEEHVHAASMRVPRLCADCHAGQPPALIGGKINEPCYRCHGTKDYPRFSNRSIYEKTPHGSQNGGDCTNCHAPHGINNYHRHLLTRAAPSTSNPVCFGCHHEPRSSDRHDYPGEAEFSRSDNPHGNPHPDHQDLHAVHPGSEAHLGECYNCHNPHGATVDGSPQGALTTALTRVEGVKLCIGCHADFASRVQAGTKHRCSLCHYVHQPSRDGVILLKVPGASGSRPANLAAYQGEHRGYRLFKDEYCLACHQAGGQAASSDPFGSGTGFRARAHNLHNAHSKRDGVSEEQRVWCAECHDVHPNARTLQNALGPKLLRTAVITAIARPGAYTGKGSCGLDPDYPCHQGDR